MSVPAADKGRRRRALDDEGEDEDTGTSPVTRPSECESEGEGADIDLSEYESAVDESADAQDETEEGSETETEEGSDSEEETGSETETEGGEEYTDDEGLEEERQSGDGEEQPDNDKPDDDEDKKNPAYVPRKGAFYEHDFRRGEEEPEKEVEDDSKPKKKLWQDEGKWVHDRYSDDSQAPKSREELIAIYGYDIRAADKPPEAPPRRPGRGKGPRRPKFQDFVPRMAVIDTTEDGSDSVPNLGDDELVLYNEPPSRYTRKNNQRHNETRRGGRGGGRGGSYRSVDMDIQNSNNHSGYSSHSGEGPNNQDNRREIISQDIRASEDFPSLEESTQQSGPRDNRSGRRSDNYEKIRNDTRPNDRGPRTYQNDIRDNRRGEYREQGFHRDDHSGRYQSSQDSRRQEGNNRYQQGYRDDIRGRGGYNNNRGGSRNGQFSNSRSEKENWRSSPGEVKDSYVRDDYSRNQQDYGYNRRPHYGGGDNRGPRGGHAGEMGGYSGPNKRNNRNFDQPQPYQQQQQVTEDVPGGNRQPREYTNSSFKGAEDKKRIVANTGSGPAVSSISDSGDGGVSSSKNLVISNKENVQTINVTITSTTTEKKSYAKERRAKGTRPGEAPATVTNAGSQHPVPASAAHYPGLPQSGMKIEQSAVSNATGAKRYSSQRQQGLGKGGFTEPPPVDTRGANLYNPALPPPSFFQGDHSAVAPTQHPATSATGTVQDPAHFTPTMLPPGAAAALPFGLAGVPVSSTGLALPPTATGSIPANPALFQPPTGPPPPTSIPPANAALMAAPYLPAGMMYGGAPRVPPPGAPTGFPLPMAYTSPPPPATVAATVVASQPPPQGTSPQQSTAQSHKKVYRGDITYYAPELQQPSRTPQRRPKAAIPIIDPQEIRKQKLKEKSDQRSTPEKSSASPGKQTSPAPGNGPGKALDSTPPPSVYSEQSAVKNKSDLSVPSATSLPKGSTASTEPPVQTQAAVTSSNKDIRPSAIKSGLVPSSEKVPCENTKLVVAGSNSDNGSDQKRDISPLPVGTQSFKADVVKTETTVSEQSPNKALSLPVDKMEITKGVAENSSNSSSTQVQSVINTPVNS